MERTIGTGKVHGDCGKVIHRFSEKHYSLEKCHFFIFVFFNTNFRIRAAAKEETYLRKN